MIRWAKVNFSRCELTLLVVMASIGIAAITAIIGVLVAVAYHHQDIFAYPTEMKPSKLCDSLSMTSCDR